MSKKRTRELASVDVSLVEVYEDLAHEDAEVRLKAAHKLLTQHLPDADEAQIKLILKRLFRGLCSGRKAARLGFSVALNETLSQIRANPGTVTLVEILDILESTTALDGSTTGQDGRDHYFGRIFGSHAIMTSGLLFNAPAQAQWERLLDLICTMATAKPWLREECGWILWSGVQELVKEKSLLPFLQQIIEKLVHYKLMRTPEGLAIWLSAQKAGVADLLPKKIWKHEDPLATEAIDDLAHILRDARGGSGDDIEFEVQGSAMWSAKLHFAWDIVISELLGRKGRKGQIGFTRFWKGAVDTGLFAPQGSKERKHWGFLLFRNMISTASLDVLPICFSNNAVTCLMQSLKSADRYLQKDAQMILKAIRTRCEDDPTTATSFVYGLLVAANMTDFDAATKTKTLESIWSSAPYDTSMGITSSVTALVAMPCTDDEVEATNRRRSLLNLQARLISQTVNNAIKQRVYISELECVRMTIDSWISLCNDTYPDALLKPSVSSSTKSLLLHKIALAFEQVLKIGSDGRLVLLACFSSMKEWKFTADIEITQTIKSGWERFQAHHGSALSESDTLEKTKTATLRKSKGSASSPPVRNESEALALLYGLIIFQFHNEDPEAMAVLEELLAFEADAKSKRDTIENADGLVEIILSFASKPSKLLRRMTSDIFGAFTYQITREGLLSLSNILQAKESKAGQEELFDADEAELENGGSGDSDLGSDVEMLDSKDVMPSDQDASSSSGDSSPTDTESITDESLPDTRDADLEALELSLAKALGTRKLTVDDLGNTMSDSGSESGSDSDMDDDQMLTLDAKLSEVFRTRATAQSQSKEKQKSNKAAKENMTNFKNRVLDLVEIYFRNEHYNSNSFDLILPLLALMRTTANKQLATKAGHLISTLCNKCKGFQHAARLETWGWIVDGKGEPKGTIHETLGNLGKSNGRTSTLSILQAIHKEACLPTSHAHKAACSQSSILLAKALLKAYVGIDTIIGVYSNTQVRMLMDKTASVPEAFFRDWIGWCGTVRGKIGTESQRFETSTRAKSAGHVDIGSAQNHNGVDASAGTEKKTRKRNKQKHRNKQ